MNDFPDYISIQTISGCNASCFFCPYPYVKEQIPTCKMSKDLYTKIIDECSGYRNLKVIIPYLMNEPLLDKELPEKISYIKKKLPWVSVHILTNGTSLNEEFSLRLIRSGIDWVGFSLHGLKSSTINSTMGINAEETLNNILNFINLSKKIKGEVSDFIMVTFIKNEKLSDEEKEKTFKFWEKQGIRRISYYSAPVSCAGNVPVLPKVNNARIYGCNSIWTIDMLHILSNGDVILCCMDWKHEITLGNLKNNSIFEIWNGDTYQKVRKKIKGEIPVDKDFLCLRCECAQVSPTNLDKKIQLIMLPPWGIDAPPLGLGIIAEALSSKGYEVEILDLNILLYNKVNSEDKIYWQMDHSLYWKDPNFISYLMTKYKDLFDEIETTLKKNKAAIIGFSLPTNCMNLMLKWVIDEIKSFSPEKTIVLGGISVSIAEQRNEILKLMPNKIDVIILGEGEETIVNLSTKIFDNKSINDLENAVIYKGGVEIKGNIVPIRNLNECPTPSFKKFPLHLYQVKESILVEWSRGCIAKCKFCDFIFMSKYYKKKSPKKIIDELIFYTQELGKNHFSIVDASLNGDLKWLEKICDLIISNNLNIKLTGLAIPRPDMSLELLRKMGKAGFYRLEYGVESGSDKILKSMGKIFTSQEAANILKLTRKAGIKNILYFMVGFPGETEKDFDKTLKFIRENKDYIDLVRSINPLYLMAGSELFLNLDKYRIKLPQENADIYWYIEGENDFALRMARVKKIQNLLDELRITYITDTTALPKSERKKRIKKNDLAIVTTPPWGVENPPLGIAYLSSFVRKFGYQPLVFDFNNEFYRYAGQELKNLWHVENKNCWGDPNWFPILIKIFEHKINDTIEKILKTDTQIIGFSVVDPKERLTIEFIKRIKEKDKDRKIVLGGPATLTEESRKIFLDNLQDEIDYFVIGEGEETLIDILKQKGNGEIRGSIFKSNGKWNYLLRQLIKDLDQIPFPTYEDFDLSLYPGKSLILEWSRGCISKCAFCINHELVRGYRFRSAEHILQELKYHFKINKIREFTICDPLINGNPKILDKVCDLILKENLDILWSGEAVPRPDMDIPMFKKMKRAGCFKLQIGLESGSNKVLKNMAKTYSAEIAEDFIKKASLAGIETEIFIMVGFPGEEDKEFEETVDFITRNKDYINTIKSINTLHLIAGTDIYKQREKYNIKPLPKEDWHYLWETYDGNTYRVRKSRGEFLLQVAGQLGFKVMETNLKEGKQTKDLLPSTENLKIIINSIQELPQKAKKIKLEPILPRKRWVKLPYLTLIIALTIVAEIYLWVLKKARRMIIFPGS